MNTGNTHLLKSSRSIKLAPNLLCALERFLFKRVIFKERCIYIILIKSRDDNARVHTHRIHAIISPILYKPQDSPPPSSSATSIVVPEAKRVRRFKQRDRYSAISSDDKDVAESKQNHSSEKEKEECLPGRLHCRGNIGLFARTYIHTSGSLRGTLMARAARGRVLVFE